MRSKVNKQTKQTSNNQKEKVTANKHYTPSLSLSSRSAQYAKRFEKSLVVVQCNERF